MSEIGALNHHTHYPDRGSKSQNNLLVDYYRCSESSLPSLLATHSDGQPSYFRLGPDTVCYGKHLPVIINADTSHEAGDALEHLGVWPYGIQLPFDPMEVVENLRRERYRAQIRGDDQVTNDLARKAYYLLRPLLGVSMRRQIQKLHLRGWAGITFPEWPVDTTVDRIHRKLLALSLKAEGLRKIPFIWFWPEGLSCCAVMTHDVESKAGRDFCPSLIDLDESFGIRSSFQIVPENRYRVPEELLQRIKNRGFEVNVHDLNHDGRLFADRAEFMRRAKKINEHCREFGARGFRSGCLYRNADWFDAFDFCYDMSLPNVAHLDPQRGGCCTVMPYFIGRLVELPLTCAQDYTLFHILGDYSTHLWEKQISIVRANHGLVSFIVHPDYVRMRKAQDTYCRLLALLSELRQDGNIWMPLPGEVAAWWKLRSKLELVYKSGRWQIEGSGQERARVAYAVVSGDQVTYSFES